MQIYLLFTSQIRSLGPHSCRAFSIKIQTFKLNARTCAQGALCSVFTQVMVNYVISLCSLCVARLWWDLKSPHLRWAKTRSSVFGYCSAIRVRHNVSRTDLNHEQLSVPPLQQGKISWVSFRNTGLVPLTNCLVNTCTVRILNEPLLNTSLSTSAQKEMSMRTPPLLLISNVLWHIIGI